MLSESKQTKLIVNEYRVQLNPKTLPSQLCVQVSSKPIFIDGMHTKLMDTTILIDEWMIWRNLNIFHTSGDN